MFSNLKILKNKINQNILELVGNTPIVKLNKIVKDLPCPVFAKLEFFNPGHSSKDRIGLHIIEEAAKEGILKKGATIVETTSGNTGFSIAMASAVKGYKCILAVSDKTKEDKIAFLKALGAEVHVCPANVPAEDPRSYYETAKRIHQETPNSIYINQYFNLKNIDAHYLSTGPEIWEQTDGQITHLIAASGTGGTISGVGRYLKEKNPEIKIIGVDADGSVIRTYHETGELDKSKIKPYRIEGLGKNLIPGATDFSVIDEYVTVTDEDSAYCTRLLALEEGILAGYTSGAVIQGLREYKNRLSENDFAVVIFPDHGSRYMNKVYNNDWLKEQGFNQKEF